MDDIDKEDTLLLFSDAINVSADSSRARSNAITPISVFNAHFNNDATIKDNDFHPREVVPSKLSTTPDNVRTILAPSLSLNRKGHVVVVDDVVGVVVVAAVIVEMFLSSFSFLFLLLLYISLPSINNGNNEVDKIKLNAFVALPCLPFNICLAVNVMSFPLSFKEDNVSTNRRQYS